jgi:hypothetical protein
MALAESLVEAERQTLPDVPELSVEDVLARQGTERLEFYLNRLRQALSVKQPLRQ